MAAANPKSLHIAMYPWFAFGHLTPFLHLANKLAKKGHIISFLLPPKAQGKLEQFNLYPDRITFIPINVPQVEGLPPGAETTADVPFPLLTHVMTAMDRTEVDIEALLLDLKPDIVFFDFTHWMPRLARRLGIKSIHYCTVSPSTIGYSLSPARQLSGENLTEADLRQPPRGFPASSITLHAHEALAFVVKRALIFGGVRFCDRQYVGLSECDALAFRTCREIEGTYVKYLEAEFGKPIMLSGPVIPEPPTSSLDERWAKWLGGFRAGEVIYCAFGSENTLQKDQFQELLLGLEITGMPFLAVLKPPMGVDSIEAALPQGYRERVEGRGTVHGGWVQQQLILEHPSVGCFITHCGSGSLAEALLNACQLVLLPHFGDQIINARIMSRELKVGVEVDKGEDDGLFTKDTVYKAVMAAMDDNSEIGREIRENHAKVRGLLLGEDLEESYINNFNKQLQELVE